MLASRTVASSAHATEAHSETSAARNLIPLKSLNRITVVTGSADGTALVWECSMDGGDARLKRRLTTGANTDGEWKGHTAGITSVDLAPRKARNTAAQDSILTGSKDMTAKVWDIKTGALLRTAPALEAAAAGEVHHTGYVNAAIYSKRVHGDGPQFLTCSDDRTAVVWDFGKDVCHTRRRLAGEGGHSGPVKMATFDNAPHAEHMVLTCSCDRTCRLWKHGVGVLVLPEKNASGQGHHGPVYAAHFSPDDKRIASASKDGSAKVWDVQTGHLVTTLSGHEDVVLNAVWEPVDRSEVSQQVLTCSMDCTARVWDLRLDGSKAAMKLDKHTGCVWSASYGSSSAVTGKAALILTGSHDMSALVWDPRMGMPRNILEGHTGILWQAKFSQDDEYVVTCSEDWSARVWDLTSGDKHPPCCILNRHSDAVTCALFFE